MRALVGQVIAAYRIELVDGQRIPVIAPHFPHAHRSTDSQSIERTASYVNLDDQIGRWILRQINLLFVPDSCLILKVVSLIGFEPLV